MKFGIFVYSYTGNTMSVAKKLQEVLVKKGHQAVIEEIAAENDSEAMADKIVFRKCPNTFQYDGFAFASPVRGFSLPPVMKAYLKKIPSLPGKKAVCFTTQQLPWKCMGGNRSIRKMKTALEENGVEVVAIGNIHWGKKDREHQIEDLVNRLADSIL